jgi:hypothetical protein
MLASEISYLDRRNRKYLSVVPQKNSPKVLILGSAPNVVAVKDIDVSSYDEIIVINNAWQVLGSGRSIFSHMIFPKKISHCVMQRANDRLMKSSLFEDKMNLVGSFMEVALWRLQRSIGH